MSHYAIWHLSHNIKRNTYIGQSIHKRQNHPPRLLTHPHVVLHAEHHHHYRILDTTVQVVQYCLTKHPTHHNTNQHSNHVFQRSRQYALQYALDLHPSTQSLVATESSSHLNSGGGWLKKLAVPVPDYFSNQLLDLPTDGGIPGHQIVRQNTRSISWSQLSNHTYLHSSGGRSFRVIWWHRTGLKQSTAVIESSAEAKRNPTRTG
jgi:hypothetical protein